MIDDDGRRVSLWLADPRVVLRRGRIGEEVEIVPEVVVDEGEGDGRYGQAGEVAKGPHRRRP